MGKGNIDKNKRLNFVTNKYHLDSIMSQHICIYTYIRLFKKIFSKSDFFSNRFNKSLTHIIKGARIDLNLSRVQIGD